MSKRSVLLTCAGLRVDVVRAFREALDGLGWDGDVVAVDANPLAPALVKADRGVVVPHASSPDYVPTLAELVTAHGVRAVLPLADLDNVELVTGREQIEAAGAALLLPDLAVAEAMFDKYRCHEALLAAGLPSPDTWVPEELPAGAPLPLLVKRRWGYASRDIYRCETLDEVRFFVGYAGVPVIVQKFLPGEQFSIDVLCDLDGRALNAIPRTMIESKGGESIKGQTIADQHLIDLGRTVAEGLRLVGPATIQCFDEPEGLPVTDINTRFGGAFPLPLAAGSRYPELILRMACGERVEPHVGRFTPGVTMTRFYDSVILPEDAGPAAPGGVSARRGEVPG
ncbi:MAG TPA: ATP-grasp domain-containing protein [Gaiellales bacterium]|nr:ATP-grasp domain-containing protein [Gaiellales bacterium]